MPARYTIVDLGVLDPSAHAPTSAAVALSNTGTVVGVSDFGPIGQQAFRYDSATPGATITRIGQFVDFSAANDVNDAGQIVGFGQFRADSLPRAFLYAATGQVTDLGTLGGATPSGSAEAINNQGQIVGFSQNRDGQECAVAYTFAGGVTTIADLGTLPGDVSSRASDINDWGVIVGVSTSAGRVGRAVQWVGGQPTALPGLGGASAGAVAINASGVVVGSSGLPAASGGVQHAVLWRNGRITDLETLGNATSSANGINAAGLVVGTTGNVQRAFIYGQGHMVDLNTRIAPDSGWVLTSANDINDRGQIAGTGYHNGVLRAFLITPQ